MRNKTIILIVMLLLFVQIAFAINHINVPVAKIDTRIVPVDGHINLPADNLPKVPDVKPIDALVHPFVFEDDDAIPVLHINLSATAPIANKNFSIAVSATDDKGIGIIRLMLSDGWHEFSCNNQLSCQKEWVTSEQTTGTYTYNAMVIDNAKKAAVDSVTVSLSQMCLANWVKNPVLCQTNDQKPVSYNDTNGCIIANNKPADDGTYVSCDFCAPNVSQNSSNCNSDDTKTVSQTDLNSCYSKTGLDSDKVESTLTVACDYCTPNLIEHIGQCMTNDSLIKWYSDPVNCFQQTGLPSDKVPDDQYIICDYCTPNWQAQTSACFINDTKNVYSVDANNCFAQTGLASDNNQPVNYYIPCDYCVMNISLSETSCRNDDTKLWSYSDLNNCYAVTGLPSDIVPANETVSCDFCNPYWQNSTGACAINDTAQVNYTDSYNCFAQTGLPSDNNKPSGDYIACDYCKTNMTTHFTACTASDTQTKWYSDTSGCYAITNLPSDQVPANESVSCDYCTPSLVEYNTTCAITDTYTKSYTDSNACFSLTGLNSDKVPDNQSLTCDFCTPNWQAQYTACVNENMTRYYVDANNCFAQTGLPSDNNKPANVTSNCSLPGYLEAYIVLPNQTILISGTTLVNQSRNVTVRTGVKCLGGACANVTAALDPELQRKLMQINAPVIMLSSNLINNVKEKPRTVIIEFKDDDFSLNDTIQRNKVKKNQERAIKILNSDGENFKVQYKYMLVNAMAGEITSKGLQKLLNDPSVSAVYEDFVGRASVAQGKQTLHLDVLNNFTINGKNLTGKGYSICLIDSGVNYNHESLGGGGYPNSKVIGGKNFVHNESNDVYDLNGHGTKMSGILAGNGTVRGVAPDATLVEAVVLNETNWYVGSKAYAAMDWCYANRATYNIAAVSMSFGDSVENNITSCPSYFNTPLRNMNLAGIVMAAASGNEWYNHGIAYPACSPYVIGVGSMDDGRYFGTELNNTITNFTNIGFGMNFLLAPGRGIGTTDRDTGTSSCTGTSCSTPFMAAGGLLFNQYLIEKYNRTINNPKMFRLLNTTGRQVPMEDVTRYNGTFTLPYFDEAINHFEVPQQKGLVSMLNTSTPFYTKQQNPSSCGDMAANQVCETEWNVTATGIVGTYEFYTIYTSDVSAANTSKFNVTII